MLLLVHISIALVSVGLATHTLFRPSASGLKTSYYSVGLTILSGVVLGLANVALLPRVCATGLVYMAVTLGLLAVAKRRLSTTTTS